MLVNIESLTSDVVVEPGAHGERASPQVDAKAEDPQARWAALRRQQRDDSRTRAEGFDD